MVDIIFFCFFAALFCAGFWCGSTFGNAKTFVAAISNKIKGWFD